MRKLFFEIKFDDIQRDSVVDFIVNHAGGYKYIVTPNVDHVVRYNDSEDLMFKQAYDNASLILCDSNIVRLFTFFLKNGLKNLNTGSDLTHYLVSSVPEFKEKKIFVLGSSAGDVQKLRDTFGLKSIGFYSPPFGFMNDDVEVEKLMCEVSNFSPEIIFIAVGSPRQEYLAFMMHKLNLPCLSLCVGASIDFLVGRQKRAPIFFQRLKLEWLYRLVSAPRKLWRRYLIDGPKIFPIFFRELSKRYL